MTGINIGDTYYVIATWHAALFCITFYLFNGVAYWFATRFLKFRLNRILTVIHTGISVGGYLAFVLFTVYIYLRYTPFNIFDNKDEVQNIGVFILLSAILLVQPLFLINLSIGGSRRSHQK